MIFDKIMLKEFNWVSQIIFFFGLTSLFIPYYKLLSNLMHKIGLFNSSVSVLKEYSYEDERLKFYTEYDRENPITANSAKKEYFDFLQRKIGSEAEACHLTGQLALKMFQINSDKNAYYHNEISESIARQSQLLPSSMINGGQEHFFKRFKRQSRYGESDIMSFMKEGDMSDVNPIALAALDLNNNNLESGYLHNALDSLDDERDWDIRSKKLESQEIKSKSSSSFGYGDNRKEESRKEKKLEKLESEIMHSDKNMIIEESHENIFEAGLKKGNRKLVNVMDSMGLGPESQWVLPKTLKRRNLRTHTSSWR